TTLINRLLAHPDFADSAVILNELGKTALDTDLVERADDGIVSLGSGCVCCVVRGELIEALERLLRGLDNGRIARIARVIIEADAAADPSGIVGSVARHPYLVLRYRHDGIVVVIDVGRVQAMFQTGRATVRQLAMADAIVLSAPGGADAGAARERLAGLNPGAEITDLETVVPSDLAGRGAFDPVITDPALWLHRGLPARRVEGGGEAARVSMFAVERERMIPFGALDRFLEYLAALKAKDLIRVRGVVAIEDGQRVAVSGLGGLFDPPRLIEGNVAPGPATRFAVVATDFDKAAFEAALDAFLNEARIDGPDRQALIDNPLALAGFSARPGRGG
ncbi:MAG: GTP-binding protein, partial [Bauldia sp.]